MMISRVTRRKIVAALGCTTAWPILVWAQVSAGRVWRVGYLSASAEPLTFSLYDAFKFKLQQLGYVEGTNLRLDVRLAAGDYTRLPNLASELAALAPDVIVSGSTVATFALKTATTSIPIVMASSTDPVGAGFINSLSRPGGNITGLSNQGIDLTAKSLELLHVAVPKARRIAVLRSPNPIHDAMIVDAYKAAELLDLTIVPVMAKTPGDLNVAFSMIHDLNCDAVFVLTDARSAGIVELADKWRLPGIYGFPDFVYEGGLISYGPDYREMWRQAAIYVDKIIRGASPAELPVQQPARLALLINLKTAKALGLTIPDSILARADDVIE